MVSPEQEAQIAKLMGLNLQVYTMVEISFLIKMNIRKVRSFTRQQSKRDPSRKMLVAEKSDGIYRVKKEDLKIFLEEMYGGRA